MGPLALALQLEVRIGEIGWPSDGNPAATLALSRQFNQAAVAHLTSGVGTPRRPKAVIPFYLFGLLDEDAKSVRPGPFERRWGLYDQLGEAKFNLDLSGNANPAAPLPTIPGLRSLPKRWCIAAQDLTSNPDSADTQVTLQTLLTNICGGDPSQSFDYNDAGDCTPLTATLSSPGLQCAAASKSAPFPLGFNASYALNAKFQVRGESLFTRYLYAGTFKRRSTHEQALRICSVLCGLRKVLLSTARVSFARLCVCQAQRQNFQLVHLVLLCCICCFCLLCSAVCVTGARPEFHLMHLWRRQYCSVQYCAVL